MSSPTENSVVAVFDRPGSAECAIAELWHAGFPPKKIGLAAPGEPFHQPDTAIGRVEDKAAQGAQTGAIAGGSVGAILGGLAVGFVPGIGQVLVGGILGGIVMGAAMGAAWGTFAGPFLALGFSNEEARYYQEQLKTGRIVVTVQAGDRSEEAKLILKAHGGETTLEYPAEVSAG